MLTYKLNNGYLNLNVRDEAKFKRENTIAARNNKNRGFVFLSKVLGKHYPVCPNRIEQKNKELAIQLLNKLDDKPTYFIGFAETATLISQDIYAQACILNPNLKNSSVYQHSTRYLTSDKILCTFLEEHCHAPSHIFYSLKTIKQLEISIKCKNLVLIDDELSTGKTILNMLTKLLNIYKGIKNVYLVSLLNWISDENLFIIDKFAKEHNVNIEMIYSIKGNFEFKYNKNYIKKESNIQSITSLSENASKYYGDLLLGNKKSARFGINNEFIDISNININELKYKKILVLGTGEFMYKPYLVAKKLKDLNLNVKFQATTRSPLLKGVGVKSILNFKDNYFENIDNFLYNVIDKKYDYIYICYETESLPIEHNLQKLLQLHMPNTIINTIYLKD